jgi:hypothetical protein
LSGLIDSSLRILTRSMRNGLVIAEDRNDDDDDDDIDDED